ncbi:hypothetical protein K2173_027823 [Erythroxylum novogranatense]|uniref:CP12 domain-containing protein n=1 Tax=Erythroxylum novogranatense TaxID=1862640 RepID=A0AAV8U051_9ROSI|nr:hypothetical protein K2173_027823 [Erythroxylum novogranatense]
MWKTPTGTRLQAMNLYSSHTHNSGPFPSKPPSLNKIILSRKPPTARVRAAGAKFKGTHMREKQLAEMIEKKVMEAKEVCGEDEKSDGCKVAWDEVEEVSQAKADLRRKLEKQDPLEYFCLDHPETDECRIYED